MAIVYLHKNKLNDEVFYVGIGVNQSRAYVKRGRNALWKNIVSKYGYNIEITHKDICWEEACVLEKYLISFYGRRDLGKGTLCNMTDGGQVEPTEAQKKSMKEDFLKEQIGLASKNRWKDKAMREKIIASMIGRPCTEETRKKMSESRSGEKNHYFGKKLSEKHREKMRLSHLGKIRVQTEEEKLKRSKTMKEKWARIKQTKYEFNV